MAKTIRKDKTETKNKSMFTKKTDRHSVRNELAQLLRK